MSDQRRSDDEIRADLEAVNNTRMSVTFAENLALTRGERTGNTTVGAARYRLEADVPALLAENVRLRAAVNAVEKLCDEAIGGWGYPSVVVSDIRRALAAAGQDGEKS